MEVNKEHRTACAFITKGNAAFVEGKSMSDYYYKQSLNDPYLCVTAEVHPSPFLGSLLTARVSPMGPSPWPSWLLEPWKRQDGGATWAPEPPHSSPSKSPHLPLLLSAADKTCHVCRRLPSLQDDSPLPPPPIHERSAQDFGEGEHSVPPAAGLSCKACSDAFRELHVVTLSQDFT